MNINEIIKQIAKILPGVTITYEEPANPDGLFWIDIKSNDQWITVQYSSSENYFGLFLPDNECPFSKPNEIHRNFDLLLSRLQMIFIEDQVEIHLKQIRELLGKTQMDLSMISGQKQSSISKMENRNDLKLSSLKNFIGILGGSLEIVAHFKEFDLPIKLFEPKN